MSTADALLPFLLMISMPACFAEDVESASASAEAAGDDSVHEGDDEDSAEAGPDEDDLEDADDEDSGEPPNDSDDGEPGLDEDVEAATTALSGMAFVCAEPDGAFYNLRFRDDGVLLGFDDSDNMLTGEYTTVDGVIGLHFATAGLMQTSQGMEVAAGVVATFTTEDLFCHATALREPAHHEVSSATCPSIKHLPGVSYENNAFEFGNDGGVKRRRWTELLGAEDTLYSETYGVYVIAGSSVVLMFGDSDAEGERLMTGVLTDDGLYIEQLEPDRGPCA